MELFYLKRPGIEDEDACMEYLEEHLTYGAKMEGTGGLKRIYDGQITYREWLLQVLSFEEKFFAEANNFVPTNMYLLYRESDHRLIGMVQFRKELNEYIYNYAGHIGYGVRPSERQKGYAKMGLYLVLLEAKKLGLERVMVDCEPDNIASQRTIKALGGELDHRVFEPKKERYLEVYWIDVEKSLETYKEVYGPNVKEITM